MQHHHPLPLNPNVPLDALDPHAQVELLEQNITYLLQEIDANFALTHKHLESHLLPRVERLQTVSKQLLDICSPWLQFFEIFFRPSPSGDNGETIEEHADGEDQDFRYPLDQDLSGQMDSPMGGPLSTPSTVHSRLVHRLKTLQTPVRSPGFPSVRGLDSVLSRTPVTQRSGHVNSYYSPMQSSSHAKDFLGTETPTRTVRQQDQDGHSTQVGHSASPSLSLALQSENTSAYDTLADHLSLSSTPSDIRRFIKEKTPRVVTGGLRLGEEPQTHDPSSLVTPTERDSAFYGTPTVASSLMQRYATAPMQYTVAVREPQDHVQGQPSINPNTPSRTGRRLSGLTREIEALLEDDPDETVLLTELTRKYDLSTLDESSSDDDRCIPESSWTTSPHRVQDSTQGCIQGDDTWADSSYQSVGSEPLNPQQRLVYDDDGVIPPTSGMARSLVSMIGEDTVQVVLNNESPCAPKSVRWNRDMGHRPSR
ncbi:DASH complex subunit ask1 [Dispira simplex]|nr:DASH complex subunit ask1 [Dispira simplex]